MSALSWSVNIDQILWQISSKDNISDIHLSGWDYIAFRVNWEIKKMENLPKLNNEHIELILKQLMNWNQKAYEKFVTDKEADFSYIWQDWTPYRVNSYFKLWKVWVVLRKISSEAKHIEDLMFEDISQNIKDRVLSKRQWLFLVTWPTWSWKSTSLVAMINYLNHSRPDHIITIEDPVEFIFKPSKAVVSQREVWHDTWAFMNALRAAMREDPDIILVWEIRDKETAEAVLNLAETWHLVFSTLHTSSASWTINRFISFFPPEIQDSIADRLSEILIWVQSQRLVKKHDWKGRIWVYEIMINTSAVRNNIKKRQLAQIDNIIETWIKQWMMTIEQYAKRLVQEWKVDESTVSWILSAKWTAS